MSNINVFCIVVFVYYWITTLTVITYAVFYRLFRCTQRRPPMKARWKGGDEMQYSFSISILLPAGRPMVLGSLDRLTASIE